MRLNSDALLTPGNFHITLQVFLLHDKIVDNLIFLVDLVLGYLQFSLQPHILIFHHIPDHPLLHHVLV